MRKPGFRHSDQRQGKPRAPISMAQLAREGRLKPEAVSELIREGKLDQHSVAQLRANRTYPEPYLRPYSDPRQIPRGWTNGKTNSTRVRWLTFRIVRSGSRIRPWQVVTEKALASFSVYASYKHLDRAIAAATKLNDGRAPKVLDCLADRRWERK